MAYGWVMSSAFFVRLPGRGMVSISGEDRRAFLQGLVSNDINLLDGHSCVYACLLTPQGKFLHDFFITEHDGALRLECEGGARAEDLMNRLKPFRLRSKITLDFQSDFTVYAGKSPLPDHAFTDPRHADLGWRSYYPPQGVEDVPFEIWDYHRILLGVPDGSRDMVPESSTLAECNVDTLNGVSYTKGCYMGQELTARIHHRGLVKKRLQTVHEHDLGGPLPPPGTDIVLKDGRTGEMRSSCRDSGLALVKIAA